MNRFSKSSALGAADPAGQPLQHYNQPQQWPNQDQGPDADPLDGADSAGEQDDDLEADDDLPVDLPESKGSEVPEALKAERRKTNQLEHDIREISQDLGAALTSGIKLKDVQHANSHPSDAGLATALL